ncbi:hypothetical protein F7725_022192 [Dissostichus mawsoni]|uniref:Uncharacterized protein n=1 Tax=Dissostichus mawsoni TaxID=36200 RepID=A0A7J5Z027_DISMA|nr:hypothetical protein F7725_022192 [Dissostichus mawsoni]
MTVPSLMSWSVLAVEDDRGLMGAPVTCLLLCLSCGRPSGACDETMTAQSKKKLAPVNHKENPLWFSRSEGETTSPGTFSKGKLQDARLVSQTGSRLHPSSPCCIFIQSD